MPNSTGYVWEKMYSAVWSMCGKGPLPERLANAGLALHTLRDDDLETGDLHSDLQFVLKWTTNNMQGERAVKQVPDDLELRNLIEKMLHVLLETHAAD